MKHTALVALSCAGLAGLAGACKKEGAAAAGSGTASGSGSDPAAKVEPFTGKLTGDRVMRARGQVKPFDPWDAGFAKLQALLGPPTRIEGPAHTWAVVEDESCAYFSVTRDNGADYKMEGVIVGTVQSPMQTSKSSGPIGNHQACLKAAGVQPGPPEDPNAAGPPADGSPVPLATVRASVIPGRSKWKDRPVKVAATLGSISTATSGSDNYVTVSLTAGPDDKEEPLSCSLEKNAPAPDLKQGSAVIAEGTMTIGEWTSMGTGDVKLRPSLSPCKITAAPAK
jgi:hypothetical protein